MQKDYAIIFVLGALIVAMIIAMSVFFLIKALRRGKKIGMDKKLITGAIRNSALFSIVPSIPIVVGVGIMMPALGIAIPWIRLTVIGALQYEVSAAAAAGASGPGATPTDIATAVIVMTLSILSGPIFNATFYKRYQGKLAQLRETNKRKMDAITGSLLAGMLAGIMSALLVGGAFGVGKPVTAENTGITTYGEVTLITLATSMGIMVICGILLKVTKQKWIESYALPLSILVSLLSAFFAVPVFAV